MPSLSRSLSRRFGPFRFVVAGNAARDQRQFPIAADLYERYLQKRPNDSAIRIQAGHMRKEAGEFARAESHYLQAKAARPDDADLALQLGHFYKQTGRYLESLGAYRQAVSLDPKNDAAAEEQINMERRVRAKLGAPHEEGTSDLVASLERDIAALTIDDILASGLFDANWYLKTNTDVAKLGLDPLRHFLLDGRAEGRRPGPNFEPDWYLASYPEVARMGIEPFAHYLVAGRHQGLRPAGPPMYERWVKTFDTLGDDDFRMIDAHIRDERLPQPDVVLHIDAEAAALIGPTVKGLRGQRLKARTVYVCLAHDAKDGLAQSLEAAVGGDPSFRIISTSVTDQGRIDANPSGLDAPVVLLAAGVELREHALYLLSLARADGAVMAYGDEDRANAEGFRHQPFFKPDASPLLLRQIDYLGGCVLVPQSVEAGALATRLAGGDGKPADLLRAWFDEADRQSIAHVPIVLAHDHREEPTEKRRASAALPALPATPDLPSVTIIVPTRDRVELLSVCIESLLARTDYPSHLLDVVVVDNGSTDPATIEYLAAAEMRNFRVIRDPSPFNYAKLNNLAAATSKNDVLVLLNNDTEVCDPTWLRGLVRYAVMPDVGAVGPKLLYEDGTIQHAGVVLGIGVAAAHAHIGIEHDAPGDYGFAQRTREVAAVTGACLAMRRSVFEQLGGLDEKLAVAFNDVDLCLSAIQAGYRNIYVHDVWMRHFESKSRGVDDTNDKVDIFIGEANYARRKHGLLFGRDPFYNPNLSVMLDTFYGPAFPPRVTYPWREHQRARRAPRIMLLAVIAEPGSEIEQTLLYQADYLAEQGYEVVIGAPGRHPSLSTGTANIRRATVRDQQAAATYAVTNDVDCIVCHTAAYSGVSRLLGTSPKTIIQHHGFAAEAAAAGGVGRDQRVTIRLALPAAAAVIASSTQAAAELEDDAIVLPPGSDRLGIWSQASTASRNRLRDEHGWSDKVVILVEVPSGEDAERLYRQVADRLDQSRVVLIDLPTGGLGRSLFRSSPEGVGRADLLAAADIYWPAHNGSAMAEAEATGFGLPVVPAHDGDADPKSIAQSLATLAVETGLPSTWTRRPLGTSWADVLDRFATILQTNAALLGPKRYETVMLLAETPVVIDSGLFDPNAYRYFNPDVAAAKIDPWEHFSAHGAGEGRRGSYLFDSKWYLAKYPEVARSKLSPMAHYLASASASYDPNPYFSNADYLAAYPDVASSGLSPLVHYLRTGAAENRSIGDGFDARFYTQAYADVAASGMVPFVHFMKVGDAEGRLPVRPELTPVNLFDDEALAAVCGHTAMAAILPGGPIVHRQSAARFCINLLRTRDDLRRRFPDALSAGALGTFAEWITREGADELGLSPRDVYFISGLLSSDFAARLRQAYLVRNDLRRLLPFALLPEGAGGLLRWGVEHGRSEGFTLEEVWWILLQCAENPEREFWITYAFTPGWQQAGPAAETPFGDAAFREWVSRIFGIAPGRPDRRRNRFTPGEIVRIAFNAEPSWRKAHPDPFASLVTATAFVEWLTTEQAALPELAAAWLAEQDKAALVGDLLLPGVNMTGHFCYPSGLRVSTHALVRGCHDAGLRTSERDIWVQQPGDENRHVEYRGPELYDTTILLCQPEPLFDTAYARAGVAPRAERTYRVGYWYWEQDVIPDLWIEKSAEVDEVWTSTEFVGDALREKLNVPVRVIPHGIEISPFERKSRGYFGLPDDHFLFLFTFHMMSVMERKNPLGLVRAFAEEFKRDEKVSLVLKTSFGDQHPQQIAELRRAAAGANIIIIDSIYTHDEILALMDCCDSYISLHRSEGYGLTMAEAMLIGKPTIATGYSGNLNFMSPDNSLLVEYDLVKLDKDYPPYKAGSHWAHASIPHARACMRRVQSQPDWARELGARAKADLESRLSFAASGRMIAARLAEIDDSRRHS